MICIIMGVSGSGKSTIGNLLGKRTGWTFYDGDDFHPPENIEKMSRGIPLSDRDRQPWLLALQKLIDEAIARKSNLVIACSALKDSYRQTLHSSHQEVVWVYLKGDRQQLEQRLQQRHNHFMKSKMLESQLETLEEPKEALTVSISESSEAIVAKILDYLDRKKSTDKQGAHI
ncbi:MAG: gluconokinase [Xenococcaceae cyanobacterium]